MPNANDYLEPILTKDLKEGDVILHIDDTPMSVVAIGDAKMIAGEAWFVPISRENGEVEVLYHKITWAEDDERIPILFKVKK